MKQRIEYLERDLAQSNQKLADSESQVNDLKQKLEESNT